MFPREVENISSWKDRVELFKKNIIIEFAHTYIQENNVGPTKGVHVINSLLLHAKQKKYISGKDYALETIEVPDQILKNFEKYFQNKMEETPILKFLRDGLMHDINSSRIMYDADKEKVQKFLINYLTNFFDSKDINAADFVNKKDSTVTYDLKGIMKKLESMTQDPLSKESKSEYKSERKKS